MKTLFTTLAILFTFTLFAQDVTVAPSITSLQFNFGAIHLVHEKGLSDKTTLRLEAGVNQQFSYSSSETFANYYGIRPVVGIGVRHYYNLAKRAEKGKRTDNNSGNFVGLITQYRPDFFLYNTNDNITAGSSVNATAQWGIRRQLGRHFDFEFTAGMNLQAGGRLLGRRSIIGGSFPHLGVRFGYRF